MTKIYALQTAEMVGCALEGTAEWYCHFHSPHATELSALRTAEYELDRIRDEDLKQMQQDHPIDQYCEADYMNRIIPATEASNIIELVRRNGTDSIPIARMVVTHSSVMEVV